MFSSLSVPLLAAVLMLSGTAAHCATSVFLTEVGEGWAGIAVNGGAVRRLWAGQASPEGVKLVAATRDAATILVDGRAVTLRVGQTHPPSVTIAADARGYFRVLAQVNGKTLRAVVDTGASAVYMGRTHAAQLGIDTARGRRSEFASFRGPRTIWVAKLDRVQVGALTARDVEVWVVEEGEEGPPEPLIGMSFLQRFDVRVVGGTMTLTERGAR